MANTTWSTTDKTSGITLSGTNNLTATANSLGFQGVRTIDRQISGKFYWEYTFTNTTNDACGIANASASLSGVGFNGGNNNAAYVNSVGSVYVNASASLASLGSFSTGGVACVALDLTNQLIWFRNGAAGNWNNSGSANPATASGGFSIAAFGVSAIYGLMSCQNASPSGAVTANFGDSAFSGTVPSGFTSGFPTGTPPLIAATTQTALEMWTMPNAAAQSTQVGLEMWASVPATTVQALVTQIGLEQWAAIPAAVVASAQTRAVILA